MLRIPARRKVSGRASKGDPPVLGCDNAALDDPEARPTGRERHETCIKPNLVEPHWARDHRVEEPC
jgi:hypothetical protein